ncbi:hypothetical protein GDO81_002024 [Engystomops pustulosus]|uniref:Uncharacterized protein n=1 Tax=Engystomops pustulosus TaxID=76066 RepID=A0AAV7DIJ2_ENGPU|nr:hypothetical protein GDO81_002024 [Engystomops pustulosus]
MQYHGVYQQEPDMYNGGRTHTLRFPPSPGDDINLMLDNPVPQYLYISKILYNGGLFVSIMCLILCSAPMTEHRSGKRGYRCEQTLH